MNGNDMIEFEEKNIETLDEEFLLEHSKEFLKYLIDTNSLGYLETTVDNFKESHEDEWYKFVENKWNNYVVGDL